MPLVTCTVENPAFERVRRFFERKGSECFTNNAGFGYIIWMIKSRFPCQLAPFTPGSSTVDRESSALKILIDTIVIRGQRNPNGSSSGDVIHWPDNLWIHDGWQLFPQKHALPYSGTFFHSNSLLSVEWGVFHCFAIVFSDLILVLGPEKLGFGDLFVQSTARMNEERTKRKRAVLFFSFLVLSEPLRARDTHVHVPSCKPF